MKLHNIGWVRKYRSIVQTVLDLIFIYGLTKMKKKEVKIKKMVETIPSVNIRTTYYENKETGEFLGVEHEWQDVLGEWHPL
jgi:hypothetical protein